MFWFLFFCLPTVFGKKSKVDGFKLDDATTFTGGISGKLIWKRQNVCLNTLVTEELNMVCASMGFGNSLGVQPLCVSSDENARRNYKKISVNCPDDIISGWTEGDTVANCEVEPVRTCMDPCQAMTLSCASTAADKCILTDNRKACNRLRKKLVDTCIWENDACIRIANSVVSCDGKDKQQCKRKDNNSKTVCTFSAHVDPSVCMFTTDYDALSVCAKSARREKKCRANSRKCKFVGGNCLDRDGTEEPACNTGNNKKHCYRLSQGDKYCEWTGVACQKSTAPVVKPSLSSVLEFDDDICIEEYPRDRYFPAYKFVHGPVTEEEIKVSLQECGELIYAEDPTVVRFIYANYDFGGGGLWQVCGYNIHENVLCPDTLKRHLGEGGKVYPKGYILKKQNDKGKAPRQPVCDAAVNAQQCDRESRKGDGANCVWTGTACVLNGTPLPKEGDCGKGLNKVACDREREKGIQCVWQGAEEDEPCKENGTPLVEVCGVDAKNQQHCERIGEKTVQCRWVDGVCIENGQKDCGWALNLSGCIRLKDNLSINCVWVGNKCELDGVKPVYTCSEGLNLRDCERLRKFDETKTCGWNGSSCVANWVKPAYTQAQCEAIGNNIQKCKRAKDQGCAYDYQEDKCVKPEE